MRLSFGPFVLEVDEARLLRDGEPVQVQPLVIDVIRFLACRPGQLVTREDLLSGVWPGVRVSDQTLSQAVRRARKALGDDADQERWISTVARRGYRFADEVSNEATEPSRGGNLPAFMVELVGREEELAALALRLAGDEPVLTLVGPAGTGKTLLALHAAQRSEREAWLVDLSAVREGDGVVAALGVTLGVRLDPNPIVALQVALDRPVLIVLDNAEHLLDPVASLLTALLRSTRSARFLVTSRESLRIASEGIVPVGPLSEEEGAELFVRRLAARGERYTSPEDRATMRAIAAALDGIPLAIELAAARTGLLTPQQILARLDQPLALLAGASRDAVHRHATLRAALQWSWDLLRSEEQDALRSCTAFRGNFTVEAAEAVIGAPSLDCVQALVDKSLLSPGPSPTRFVLSRIVRSFVLEKLADGKDAAAQQRHAAWYSAMGARLFEAELDNPSFEPERGTRPERAELLAVVERATSADQAGQAVLGLASLLLQEGPLTLLTSLGQAVLARPDLSDEVRVRLSWVIGAALPPSEGVELLDRAFALAEALGEKALAGRISIAAVAVWSRLDTARSRQWLERATLLAPPLWRGPLCDVEGALLWREGRIEEARACYVSGLELFRLSGSRRYQTTLLGLLGLVDTVTGRYAEARQWLEEALDLARTREDRRMEAVTRGYLGDLSRMEGQPEEATTWLSAAVEGHRKVGNQRFLALDQLSLAEALRDCGRLVEAVEIVRIAIPALSDLGEDRACGLALSLQAELGPPSEAEQTFQLAEQRLGAGNARLQLALMYCARGRVALREGGDAHQWLARARETASPLKLGEETELGQALRALEEGIARSN